MAFDGISQRHATLATIARALRASAFDRVQFDMAADGGYCGTAACIAGHCLLLERPNVTQQDVVNELEGAPPRLKALYLATDGRDERHWWDPDASNPILAAKAIDNYLAGAELPWKGVLFD